LYFICWVLFGLGKYTQNAEKLNVDFEILMQKKRLSKLIAFKIYDVS